MCVCLGFLTRPGLLLLVDTNRFDILLPLKASLHVSNLDPNDVGETLFFSLSNRLGLAWCRFVCVHSLGIAFFFLKLDLCWTLS